MNQIIFSSMRTPDGTVLISYAVHDYVTHVDANGKEYMLDGGLEYVRASANGDEQFITQYYKPQDHKHNRTWTHWGTFGKEGKGPMKRVPVHQMETAHIEAILQNYEAGTQPLPQWRLEVFRTELMWRESHD